jgi:fused signal recognition particle receptor
MGANNFADRLKNFFGLRKSISEEFFEDLTDLLVEGDFGAAEAMKTVERLREIYKKEKIADPADLRQKLAELLEAQLTGAHAALPADGLAVILLLGVNGVGKTTTAAKLARLYRDRDNRKPILAAADTFRAAAIDQLRIHGERLGVRVIAHQHGGDPAAVVVLPTPFTPSNSITARPSAGSAAWAPVN